MKSTFVKSVLVLIVIFSTISIYAQEQKKAVEVEWDGKPLVKPRIDPEEALMRPRWIIPFIEISPDFEPLIIVANAGLDPVKVRIIFYDSNGKVQNVQVNSLERKENTYFYPYYEEFPDNTFNGHAEIEANSLHIFVSAFYQDSDNKSVPIHIFRM
jgi:hypothetical protein